MQGMAEIPLPDRPGRPGGPEPVRAARRAAIAAAVLVLLWLLLAASPCRAQEEEPAGGAEAGPKVAEVRIVGAEAVSEKTIRDLMRLKGPTWWQPTTWFRERPRFSQDALEADVGRLTDLYRAEGYYSAEVKPTVAPAGEGAVAITISIAEGPRTHVKQLYLNVQGEQAAQWQERLRPLLLLAPGDPFTVEAYQRSKARLAERLLNEGHARAEVTGDVVVVRSLQEAVVNFNVNPGPLSYFGRTRVSGLEVYEDKYVREELTYKEGERFSQRKLDESQRRIYSLGLFSTALMRPLTTEVTGEDRVPVEVYVTERPRYTTRLGVGYGSEDEFRFQASWTLRRFLGDLRLLTLGAKYSSLVAGLQAGFTQPFFIDRKSNLYDYVDLTRNTLEAFTSEAVNNRLIVDRTLSRHWKVYGGHRLELTHLSNVTQPEAIPETTPRDSLVSALEAGVARDTTTDPYYPESGSQLTFAYEQATEGLGSELQYGRGVVEGRLYSQLIAPQVVLALRLRLGAVFPTEDTPEVPIYKRFFTGGTNSVRGYGFQRLGPLDAAGKPLGGVSLTEGNVEMRFPIRGKLFGVTFVDFGQVSLKEFDYDPGNLLFSAGTGLRYATIIGPVRIDWAYKLNTIAGGEPDRWRLHFSIGQAF